MDVTAQLRLKNSILLEFREQHSLTQKQAADECGVWLGAWTAMELMHFSSVSAPAAQKIADYIGVDLERIAPRELVEHDCGVQVARRFFVPNHALLSFASKTVERLTLPPPSDDNEVNTEDRVAAINKAMSVLTQRERRIIEGRFGLNGKQQMTLAELGKELNVTRAYVRYIEQKALRKLSLPEPMYRLANAVLDNAFYPQSCVDAVEGAKKT
jgi:RNA polymerase sigma factor (sigma-70 family)